jgi:signal transduction histidine kinase
MTGSLRRRLTILLTGASLGLVLVAALGLASLVRLTNARDDLVGRVQLARIASLDLQVALFAQQASMRGFVLSGGADDVLLADFESALEVELAAADELVDALGDDPLVIRQLDALGVIAERWRSTLARPAIDATTAGRQDEALALLSDPDLTRFEQVSDAGVDLGAAMRERRDIAVAGIDRAIRQLVFVASLALGLVVALGTVLVVALRRQVLTPLDHLAAEARTVATGDFEHEVVELGPDEIRALARDVEAMRWQILAELQQTEAARAESVQQAIDLQRSNRDLEQFAYVASHDLQEPLRKVAGFCQLLERRYGPQLDERAGEYIHYAVDGAQRMQALINDLLMFSRVGRTTERFERVDLDAAVEHAWRDLATDEAALDASDLPSVAGDPALMRTLFANLMSNAIKFRSDAPPRVRVWAAHVDDTWEIAVEDNGIGIDPQFADRIFDIFQRLHTRDVYEGTGIGLAICKRIVEFHGGSIRLAPSNGGTCFVVTLPVLGDEADIGPPPEPLIPYRPGDATS